MSEFQIVKRGRRCNQRVTQFHMMAFREPMKVFTGVAAYRNIYRDTLDNRKERCERRVFRRPRAVPEFRDSDR